jgi:hypothetical protein
MNAIDEGVRRELWERWMAVMWLRCPDCAATGFGLELTECLDDPEFWQRKPSPFGRTFVSTHQILYQLAGWGFDRAEKDELPTEETLERAMEEILDYGRRGDADGAEWQGTGGPISGVALVPAAEAAEIRIKWKELLEPYVARSVGSALRLEPGQRYVRYFMAGTPLPKVDPEDACHDADN